MNTVLKMMWKEEFVAEFEVLCRNSPGRPEEDYKKPQRILCLGRDSKENFP
jgi:hypothetical protein